MATSKTAAKLAAKKAAPKKSEPKKAPEPTAVDVALLVVGDAHAVLDLDGKRFRLGGETVAALRRSFETAHAAINPGH